jgi:predicted RND superfamily exporter protein
MTRMLDLLARIAIRVPALTLAVLLAATVAFGAAASTLEVDTGLEGFAPEGGVSDTLDAIDERFGATSAVQLLVDAGPGGDVLTADGLAAAQALEDALAADPAIAAVVGPDRIGRPAIVSYALPFSMAGTRDTPVTELDPTTLDLVVGEVLDAAGEEIEPLLSDDLERDPPRARSGLLQVEFDAGAPSEDRADAARAAEAIAAATDTPGLRVSVLSFTAIEDAIEAALERELPVLLGVSLLLVLGVLAWLFRSVSDVIVGFFGLMAAIIWMAGIAALLGPNGIGLTGHLTQIAIAVPVLLVGLGIDYSVHLTSRYREQRAVGDDPERSARIAMGTVGFALVLATIASVAGFLANIATPLPPIRDFGIFAAVGIVAAFVILGGAVPATRTLLDRRTAARPDRSPAAERVDAPDPWWVRLTSTLATRHVGAVLGTTGALLVIGGVVATGLGTEFDERDFLPEGDTVIATLDRIETQFGGDIAERTYVVIDGDTSDPGLLAAAARFERQLAAIDGVRTIGDRPQVVSPFELIERLGEVGGRTRMLLASELDGWADPEAAAAGIPLPRPLDPALVEGQDASADLPDELLAALEPRLPEGRSATAALVATGDPDELESLVRSVLADDLRASRPAGLTEAQLTALAALPEDELTLASLEAGGFPMDELTATQRDELTLIDELAAAGFVADGPIDGDALLVQLAVLDAQVPDELAAVLDHAGMLLVVSTFGGQDAAPELVTAMDALAADVEAAGGTLSFASDPLLAAEIIDELSSAQLLAILISLVAATVLLITATLATSRSVALGLIGIVPSTVALVLVLASMRLLGLSFNALTATVASIAVGIGVPYGIHLINRFREARASGLEADDAITDSLRHTGAALVGSAVTTGLAFAVLLLSESTPIEQFGTVSALMIAYALLACLLVQPALLVLWARRRERVGRAGTQGAIGHTEADTDPEGTSAVVLPGR